MKVVEEAITNHAEYFDNQHMAASTLKLDVIRVAASMAANDQGMKKSINDNDETMKQVISDNDANFKKVMDQEIADMKKVIDEQAVKTGNHFQEAVHAFKQDIRALQAEMNSMKVSGAGGSTGNDQLPADLSVQMARTTAHLDEAKLKFEGTILNFEHRFTAIESRMASGDPWHNGTTAGNNDTQQQQQQAQAQQQQAQQPQQQQEQTHQSYARPTGTRSMGMDGKRLFDDRVAQVEKMHYKDKSPLTWVKQTSNYLISRVREANTLLQWAVK